MSVSQWQTLLSDVEQGQAALSVLLRQKTSFFQTLPWLLSGVAHHDPDPHVARRIGQQCLDRFAEDPHPEAHHRLTSLLLGADAIFRFELELFIRGSWPLPAERRLRQATGGSAVHHHGGNVHRIAARPRNLGTKTTPYRTITSVTCQPLTSHGAVAAPRILAYGTIHRMFPASSLAATGRSPSQLGVTSLPATTA